MVLEPPDNTLEEKLLAEIQAEELLAPYETGEPIVLVLLEAVEAAEDES